LAYAFTTFAMALQAGKNYEVSVYKNDITAKAKATVLTPLKLNFSERHTGIYNHIRSIDYDITNKPYEQYFRTLIAYRDKDYICTQDKETRKLEIVDSIIYYKYDIEKIYQFDEDQHLYTVYIDHLKIPPDCINRSNTANCSGKTDSIPVQVSIQLIDSNLINYIAQIEYQKDIEYNPFLEPAPVDQQVENGLGILTSVATSKWETFWVKCRK